MAFLRTYAQEQQEEQENTLQGPRPGNDQNTPTIVVQDYDSKRPA